MATGMVRELKGSNACHQTRGDLFLPLVFSFVSFRVFFAVSTTIIVILFNSLQYVQLLDITVSGLFSLVLIRLACSTSREGKKSSLLSRKVRFEKRNDKEMPSPGLPLVPLELFIR